MTNNKFNTKKVCILTSREIGEKCIEWAKFNTPKGFELIEDFKKADIIISVMFDKIIKKQDLKHKNCYNFHPGTLPEYKGTGIFSWAIINEESKMGVTLHLIDDGVDTGDIIEIRQFLISKDDTAHSLFLKGCKVIYKMFKNWYHDLLNQDYQAVPQDTSKGKNYYLKDLQKAKNLTKFAKAFYFPSKESAYYYNDKHEKIYISYKNDI